MRPSPDTDAPFTGYGADFVGANQALRSRPHIPMSHKDRVGRGPVRYAAPAARPRRVKITLPRRALGTPERTLRREAVTGAGRAEFTHMGCVGGEAMNGRPWCGTTRRGRGGRAGLAECATALNRSYAALRKRTSRLGVVRSTAADREAESVSAYQARTFGVSCADAFRFDPLARKEKPIPPRSPPSEGEVERRWARSLLGARTPRRKHPK